MSRASKDQWCRRNRRRIVDQKVNIEILRSNESNEDLAERLGIRVGRVKNARIKQCHCMGMTVDQIARVMECDKGHAKRVVNGSQDFQIWYAEQVRKGAIV